MDDVFTSTIESKVLDFATDKRAVWEQKHQLYSVIFEITPKCNFNCVHCYLHDHHCSNQLSYEKIIEIIDILYDNGVLFLTFTGGDVFTRDDFADIYLYAKKKGFIIEIYTNGALIDDKLLGIFRHYPPLLVDISLYGSCEETYKVVTGVSGAFSKVMDNIEALCEANIRVSLKAPVLNIYYSELEKMREIAEHFSIPFRTGFEIFTSIDNDDSVKRFSVPIKDSLKYEFSQFPKKAKSTGTDTDFVVVKLLEERPLFRCKLGRSSCVIDYEGRMCPCMSFRHAGEEFNAENFNDIWMSFGEYSKMKASPEYKCLRCEAYDYCDICPAMMQFVYDDLEHVDEHFCKSAKARFARYEKHLSIEDAITEI